MHFCHFLSFSPGRVTKKIIFFGTTKLTLVIARPEVSNITVSEDEIQAKLTKPNVTDERQLRVRQQ